MLKYILFIFLSFSSFAAEDKAMISNSFSIPIIVETDIQKINNNTYKVRELCNSLQGYVVTLHSDVVTTVVYDGVTYSVVNGEAIITNVTSQRRTINVVKTLVVNPPGSFTLNIRANE